MDLLTSTLMVAGIVTCLSRLVTRETGLFGVFVRLRNHFPTESQFYEIVNCPLCFAVWASGAVTLAVVVVFGFPVWWFVLIAPAACGFAYALLGLASGIT